MRQFTVAWWRPAEQELARLWLASSDRAKLTAAANEIDRLLSVDPNVVGGEGREGFRTLIVDPLYVRYSVKPEDRLVEVWSVSLTTPQTGGP